MVKDKFRISIGLAFFLISISYFSQQYPFAPLKYLGLIIIDAIALKSVITSHQIEKRKFVVMIALSYYFIFPLVLGGRGSEITNAIIYVVQFAVIIFYSKNIFHTSNDILSAAIGGIAAMILAFAIDPAIVFRQMSYRFGRVRICGAFAHPNTLGAVALSVYIYLIVYLSLQKQIKGLSKILVFLSIAGSVFAAFLSDSNNAKFGVLLFTLIIITFKIVELFSIHRVVANIIMVVFVIVFGVLLVNSFDAELTDSLVNRVSSIEFISSMSLFEVLFGTGIVGGGQLGIGFGAEFSLTQIIYKTGIIGCLIYVLIFLNWVLQSKKVSAIRANYVKYVMITFLVCSVAEPYITNITNILPMFLLILISTLADPNHLLPE